MKLKKILYRWTKEEYQQVGNVSIPQENRGYDAYGCNLFVLINGKSHPTIVSQGGRFDEAAWEYVVVPDKLDEPDAPQKQVGLYIDVQVNGSLDNDKSPPDIAFACFDITLKVIAPKPFVVFSPAPFFSNSNSNLSIYKGFQIKPLKPSPEHTVLQLGLTRNVVLDHHPTSWADHKSQIILKLEPFLYDPFEPEEVATGSSLKKVTA